MAIEQYARAEATTYGTECHPGLEYRENDDVELLTEELQDIAQEALDTSCVYYKDFHNMASGIVVSWILSNYPDRAYFVETERCGRGVQVYDPRDFVKERCACRN